MNMQRKMVGKALDYRPMIEAELTQDERTKAYAGQARMEQFARIAQTQLRAASISVGQKTGQPARWYCLQIEKGREFSVESLLHSADVEAFLPCESLVRVHRGKKIEGTYPLLAGYLLVRFVPSAAAFQGLKRQKYVVDIVGGPYGYHVVHDKDVQVLQALKEKPADFRMATDKTFKEGDHGEITCGPFSGFVCLVTAVKWCRQARASVTIDLFGKVFKIDSMPLAFLKKV